MNRYEIEACVIRAKNGNREELLKVLEQFKPFIFKTAAQFNIKNYDTYDLVQIGYVTLINAVAKYRTGSNTFSCYAFRSIENAFKYTARQNSKYYDDLSLNEPVDPEDKNSKEFIDCMGTEEELDEDIIRLENIEQVKRAVSKLPADELELIIMVYYSSIPLKTYAIKKGLGYQHAIRKKKMILEKLGRYIKK